jgi:uncharacterized protein YkwD
MAFSSRRLRRVVVAGAVTLGLGMLGCAAPTRRGGVAGSGEPRPTLDHEQAAAALVEAHNLVRSERRLPPLTVSGALQAAASTHARDMARRHWMSHRGGDFSSPFRRIRTQGYAFRRAGENVAAGYPSVDSVMKGWMRSPGHRGNILGRYSEIGAACAIASDGTPYWCVTFGVPEGA